MSYRQDKLLYPCCRDGSESARIVDMMEARGIVGPQDGSRPRQVLLSEDELNEMKNEVETE